MKREVLRMSSLIGKHIFGERKSIDWVVQQSPPAFNMIVEGKVVNLLVLPTKNGKWMYKGVVYDGTTSLAFIAFSEQPVPLKENMIVCIKGILQEDNYDEGELVLKVNDLNDLGDVSKHYTDEHPVKRVEFDAFTKMTQLRGNVIVSELFDLAKQYGHKAVAITDKDSAQSFHAAAKAAKKTGVKPIYGNTFSVFQPKELVVYNANDKLLTDQKYVVFDVETTGLSAEWNDIIELAAVVVENGEVTNTFSKLIKGTEPISEFIEKLTGISPAMVEEEGVTLEEAITEFDTLIQGAVLVAQNAQFDRDHLKTAYKQLGKRMPKCTIVDTIGIAQILFPTMRKYNLAELAKKFKVELLQHHRALDDSIATAHIFINMIQELIKKEIVTFNDLNKHQQAPKRVYGDEVTIYAKNQKGFKRLYELISIAHTAGLTKKQAFLTWDQINEDRENVIVMSGSHLGRVFDWSLFKTEEMVEEEIKRYDVIKIQPSSVAEHYVNRKKTNSIKTIDAAWERVYRLAKKHNKPVIASGFVHYLHPEGRKAYNIIRYSEVPPAQMPHWKRIGKIDDWEGPCHFRPTHEMMNEFPYLSAMERHEVVISTPNAIADSIEHIEAAPDNLFTPKIEGSNEQVRNLVYERAHAIYGEKLPDVVYQRIEKELKSIIGHGFSVIYLITRDLVLKSLEDGYLVGSRGSVGSSFAATLLQITEVNPLPPHYVCPECQHSEWVDVLKTGVKCGYDLPNKECPDCGKDMHRDGQDIPFETFLGFKGDKVPDIDLNFSGEIQTAMQKYIENRFGSQYVFRAGTVGTIAEKTAFGDVKRYAENNEQKWSKAEIARLAKEVTGVKKSSGQHAGGMIIIPDYKDVHDFTPYQFPANDVEAEFQTTHIDFESMHDNVLKMDILGHDDETILKILHEITGIDPKTISVNDPEIMALFTDPERILGISLDDIEAKTGTLGIPELGTDFVQGMILDIKPKTIDDLIKISGLSHGTDVWLKNAQVLLQKGTCSFSDVIGCRDDIMIELIRKGLEPSMAFKIMESVRKGKGLTDEWETEMKAHGVPDWYIWSCKMIKYMFPKAHAAAYILSALRITYFKIKHPIEYYAAELSVRHNQEDVKEIMKSPEELRLRIRELVKEIKEKKAINKTRQKEENTKKALDIVLEAKVRGISFGNVQLYGSHALRYTIHNNQLIPPFASVPGIGPTVAERLYQEAKRAPFTGIEDLQQRTGLNKKGVEALNNLGVLDYFYQKRQLQFFMNYDEQQIS